MKGLVNSKPKGSLFCVGTGAAIVAAPTMQREGNENEYNTFQCFIGPRC